MLAQAEFSSPSSSPPLLPSPPPPLPSFLPGHVSVVLSLVPLASCWSRVRASKRTRCCFAPTAVCCLVRALAKRCPHPTSVNEPMGEPTAVLHTYFPGHGMGYMERKLCTENFACAFVSFLSLCFVLFLFLSLSSQVDPMEPPKHKHKKVPRAPADDPVPVLHSPPRKVTHTASTLGNSTPVTTCGCFFWGRGSGRVVYVKRFGIARETMYRDTSVERVAPWKVSIVVAPSFRLEVL